MLDRLNDRDWEEAFGYADGFTREDVEEILFIEDGANDAEDWVGVFRLKDGRFAKLGAWCDYTGWDCQAGGRSEIALSREEILTLGLTDDERKRLGINTVAVAGIP